MFSLTIAIEPIFLPCLLHVGEEAHVGRGIVARDRRAAEHPFEAAAGDVERRRFADHERNAVALGDRGRGEAARRLIGAEQHVHLVLRDQARGQLLRERGIALVVDEDQLELRAAEIGQARASLASGRLPSSGCALLTISAASSAAALDAWPAAPALPVSGHVMPTLTVSAAAAGPAA